MVVLIDQDGPLADFERGFLICWRKRFPKENYVPLARRKSFYVRSDYPKALRRKVESVYLAKGFYRSLPAVEGSVRAIRHLIKSGYDVRICSSPLSQYKNCVLEKYQWVEDHLGRDFVKRIILAKDKTLIRGNYLIDDKPEIEGAETAEWEHIIFDRPYNCSVTNKRRLTWKNWKIVLKLS